MLIIFMGACMKKKRFIFSAIGVFFLSFAAAVSLSSRDFEIAHAATDIGTMNLSIDPSAATTGNGLYLMCDNTNPVPEDPANWTTKFTSNEVNSITLNGVDIHNVEGREPIAIKKINTHKYYVTLLDSGYGSREAGDTIVIKGNWTSTVDGVTYTGYINEVTVVWSGSKWTPGLEEYNKVSLVQLSLDDIDGKAIDTEGVANSWNTFTPSPNNTHNNFAFEFDLESYSKVEGTFRIRIGANGGWGGSGHHYIVDFNNNWGPKGVMVLYEMPKPDVTPLKKSGDINLDMAPGQRHHVEIGMIVVKGTSDLYWYVKYDGVIAFDETFTPSTLDKTPRISMYYDKTNFFLGNSLDQRPNTDALTFKSSSATDSVLFDGPTNDIPVSPYAKGAPASKYNFYRNDSYLFAFAINTSAIFTKTAANEYRISFSDNNITVEDGDIVSIGGEFHFYVNDKPYTMAVIPFCIQRMGNQYIYVSSLDDYLEDQIDNYVDYNNYDEDKIPTINTYIASAHAAIEDASSVRQKWNAFEEGKDQLDSIPPKEELLVRAQQQAIDKLNTYDDEFLYEPDELAQVQHFIADGITAIEAATTLLQVKTALNDAISLIETQTTRQEHVEHRILNREDGYQQYLAKNEVITTTDLAATGDLKFYAQGSENESYGTKFGPNSIYGRFSTTDDNPRGNVAFKFKYSSTNPSSNRYGSQIFIRLRGNDSNCYIFNIATSVEGSLGVSFAKFINDAQEDIEGKQYAFAADTEYSIEVGTIDLKDYDRVYVYIMINDVVQVGDIIDPINVEHTSTISILDSYTAAGSDAVATMKPVETGTTKETNSKKLGRLALVDSASSSTGLVATLRKNPIPLNTNLYPISQNAYTYNDHEINNFHSGVLIRKLTDTQYEISLHNLNIQDGDTIHINGCFAYLTDGSFVKTAVKLSDTTFTYHGATNSWTQSEQDLDGAKIDAIAYLETYAVLDAYSDVNKASIQSIVANYSSQIEAATTIAQIDQLVETATNAIDAIPTILVEYKNAAKSALNAYKSPSIYREAEQKQLASILASAFQRIDASADKDSVDYIVLTTKQAIDLLKTSAEYYAEELQSKQRSAKAEIEALISRVELSRYSEENAAIIQQLALQARRDVDAATSIEEIDSILANFKQSIIDVKTNDGSTFDGEKYTEKGAKKGCKGEVVTAAITVPIIAGAAAISLILIRRKRFLSINK